MIKIIFLVHIAESYFHIIFIYNNSLYKGHLKVVQIPNNIITPSILIKNQINGYINIFDCYE